MRAAVVELHAQLQAWSATEVPQHIKCAQTGSNNVERLIALSSYLSALMLLYRYLVPNPHRTSPLRGSEALARCARAASGCIRITGQVLESLPICADLIFHAQHIFAAAMILLHCIRRSDDPRFIQAVLRDVELAQRYLRHLQDSWVGGAATSNFTGFLEEYLELILSCLERGLGSHQCAFHHDEHELTGLEWRDETESCFASDWSQIGSVSAIFPAVTTGTASSSSNSNSNSNNNAMHRGSGSILSDIWNFNTPQTPASSSHPNGQWTLGAIEQDFDQVLDVSFDSGFNFGL